MKVKKYSTGLMAFCFILQASLVGAQATDATIKQEEKPKQPPAPITLTADKASLNDTTGDVLAEGNVVVVQEDKKMETQKLTGNTKQGDFFIPGTFHLTDPLSNLTGEKGQYNYLKHDGQMAAFQGKVERNYVKGQSIVFQPTQYTVYDGYFTRCPAPIPDYRIAADSIEIYPGDRIVAHNAKIMFKDTVIYSQKEYVTSLKENSQSPLPTIGYNSTVGFFIQQYLAVPIDRNTTAYTDLGYYTKSGFKPDYGIRYSQSQYTFDLRAGNYRDSNDNWIKKEPELEFSYGSHRIGKLPVTYTFDAVYGKWVDNSKTSYHQAYSLYFSHDLIKLSPTLSLSLGTGISKTLESYDHSVVDSYRYDGTLSKQWNDKLSTWVGYHYIQNTTSLFNYSQPDMSQELDTGFSYRIDKKDAIVYSQSYDVKNKKIYDQDVTWQRDLHCWQLNLTYRIKREQWRYDIALTRW